MVQLRGYLVLGAALTLGLFGACAAPPAERIVSQPPPFTAPWTATLAPPAFPATAPRTQVAAAGPSARQLLLQDAELAGFGRAEKAIYGAYPLFDVSAYSIYTYDSQPIGMPGGSGYQYRTIYRSGVSFP